MEKNDKKKCSCPHCESELENKCMEPAFCQPCSIKLIKCEKCGQLYSNSFDTCPQCKDNK